jgi:hypothetical protein
MDVEYPMWRYYVHISGGWVERDVNTSPRLGTHDERPFLRVLVPKPRNSGEDDGMNGTGGIESVVARSPLAADLTAGEGLRFNLSNLKALRAIKGPRRNYGVGINSSQGESNIHLPCSRALIEVQRRCGQKRTSSTAALSYRADSETAEKSNSVLGPGFKLPFVSRLQQPFSSVGKFLFARTNSAQVLTNVLRPVLAIPQIPGDVGEKVKKRISDYV